MSREREATEETNEALEAGIVAAIGAALLLRRQSGPPGTVRYCAIKPPAESRSPSWLEEDEE